MYSNQALGFETSTLRIKEIPDGSGEKLKLDLEYVLDKILLKQDSVFGSSSADQDFLREKVQEIFITDCMKKGTNESQSSRRSSISSLKHFILSKLYKSTTNVCYTLFKIGKDK